MGFPVFAAIVVVSLAVGAVVQVFGARRSRYDALLVSVTAAFGAYFASETFPGSSVFGVITDFGPSIDGFHPIPGIAFATLVTIIAYAGTRETYSGSPSDA